MKYLGTHHDTGKTLPSVGNAIWLSYYLGQYKGDFNDFLLRCPADAGSVQNDIYIDRRSYYDQLVAAQGVDLIILCIRCLQDEFSHFNNYYMSFSQQLVEYVYKLGYKNVKVELFSEPIEILKADQYIIMLKELRKALAYYRNRRKLQILAGAGDLHIATHRKFYKYIRDNGFHDFDAWSIHAINDPQYEMKWACENLGDNPIHITEFITLDHVLAYGANASFTIQALNRCLNYANHQPKIKSLFQVFPAKISGKYELWSVHNSTYLTKLKEFYNDYIKKEENQVASLTIPYWESSDRVRLMQFILNRNNCYCGDIDGRFGDNTLNGLNKFQKSVGLKETRFCGITHIAYMSNYLEEAKGAIAMLFALLIK